MALVNAPIQTQPYQTRYDDQEGAIRVYLGDLPLSISPRLVMAFLDAQMPFLTQVVTDPKMKVLRTAFKGAARLLMDFVVMPKARKGEMPMPDSAGMRADILTYTIGYWYAIVLQGMQQSEWEILYVEQSDGTLDITGVAPAALPTTVLAGDAAADAGPEAAAIGAGESAAGGALGSVVYSGNDRIGQDDDSGEAHAGAAGDVA